MTDPQEPRPNTVKTLTTILVGTIGLATVFAALFLDTLLEQSFIIIVGILNIIYLAIMCELAEIKQMIRDQKND